MEKDSTNRKKLGHCMKVNILSASWKEKRHRGKKGLTDWYQKRKKQENSAETLRRVLGPLWRE